MLKASRMRSRILRGDRNAPSAPEPALYRPFPIRDSRRVSALRRTTKSRREGPYASIKECACGGAGKKLYVPFRTGCDGSVEPEEDTDRFRGRCDAPVG